MGEIFIHPLATVSPQASVGPGSRIWINAQIREDAVIGARTIISKDVYIDKGVIIGEDCKIQNSVNIYNGVQIGSRVFIGPSVTFTNDRYPRAFIHEWRVIPTIVEDGASIGANSTILCGLRIGSFSMVAAGSVVTRDVKPFTLVMGNPAREVGMVAKDGTKVPS